MNKPYFVRAAWDSDAHVWVASSEDVPGLVTEADTIEALDAKLQTMVPELLEANGCLPSGESQQQPIMLMPQKHELTTQEAAAMLNVSRPFVIKQIENGTLTCKKVGRHRRIEFQDLMQYKVKMQQQTGKALDDLSMLSREMGLEY